MFENEIVTILHSGNFSTNIRDLKFYKFYSSYKFTFHYNFIVVFFNLVPVSSASILLQKSNINIIDILFSTRFVEGVSNVFNVCLTFFD